MALPGVHASHDMHPMSEEQKDKPIGDLLRDISRHGGFERVPPRGLIRPQLVRRVIFFTSLAFLLLTAAALIAVIWDCIDVILAFRCIGSMGVLLAALLIFGGINSSSMNDE